MVIRRQWSFGSYHFRGNAGKFNRILVIRVVTTLGPNLSSYLKGLLLPPLHETGRRTTPLSGVCISAQVFTPVSRLLFHSTALLYTSDLWR